MRNQCFQLSSADNCMNNGCYWCHFTTTCEGNSSSCIENCATSSLHMSCSERFQIIFLGAVIFVLTLTMIWFFIRRRREMLEDLNYKLFARLAAEASRAPFGSDSSDKTFTDENQLSWLAAHEDRNAKQKRRMAPALSYQQYIQEIDRKHNILKQSSKLESFF